MLNLRYKVKLKNPKLSLGILGDPMNQYYFLGIRTISWESVPVPMKKCLLICGFRERAWSAGIRKGLSLWKRQSLGGPLQRPPMLHLPGPPRTSQDLLGPPRTVQDLLGLPRTFWDLLGPSRTSQDLGPSRTFQDLHNNSKRESPVDGTQQLAESWPRGSSRLSAKMATQLPNISYAVV